MKIQKTGTNGTTKTGSRLFIANHLGRTIAMRWKHTPLHEILTESQAKRTLKAINISHEELPLIKYSDAALESLRQAEQSTPIGSVVRITRNTVTAGDKFYYRRVIP